MSKPKPLQYDTYYHIYNRGNNRETIFRGRDNYFHFMKLYAKHFAFAADTFAYCLLPNHFHFLVRVKTAAEIEVDYKTLRVSETLRVLPDDNQTPRVSKTLGVSPPTPSQAFSNLCNAYAKAFNKAYGRSGSLFEHPFGRIPVPTDGYFHTLVAYIHRNPQKHGLVADFRDWPYSSYDAILHDKPTRVDKTAVLDWFGGREPFQQAHQGDPDEGPLAPYLGDSEQF